MKSDAEATMQQLRVAAFKLTVAVVEGKLRKAKHYAESVLVLIEHLKKESQC